MGRNKNLVKYAVVDAFTDTEFKGNPAAVCLLEEEREDEWMQGVATEFNLSQTVFLTRIAESDSPNTPFHLRWFTPSTEVKLCGHGTLAAAHVCFSYGLVNGDTIQFSTISGSLTAQKKLELETPRSPKCGKNDVEKETFLIEIDLPAIFTTDCDSNDTLSVSKALNGIPVVDIRKTSSDDLLVVLPTTKDVTELQPQVEKIKKCPGRGVLISALAPPQSEFDFFSRFFCPKVGINEDPVCGSAHCALAPYWGKKLGKSKFLAFMASPRSGVVKLVLEEQKKRVKLQGKAVTVMQGSLML